MDARAYLNEPRLHLEHLRMLVEHELARDSMSSAPELVAMRKTRLEHSGHITCMREVVSTDFEASRRVNEIRTHLGGSTFRLQSFWRK